MPNVDRNVASAPRPLASGCLIGLLLAVVVLAGCRSAATTVVPDAPSREQPEPAAEDRQAEIAFATGLRALDAGQWEDAASAFRWAVALEPGWADARHNATIALAAAGFRDEAVDHARAYDALRADQESLYLLGWALVGAYRYSEASATLAARAPRRPDDRLLLLQGWSALALGDLQAAQRAVDALRAPTPDAYCLAAAVADDDGRTSDARALLERALADAPTHLAALRSLGLLLEQQGEHAPARPLLRSFLQRAPAWDPDRPAVEAALERLGP